MSRPFVLCPHGVLGKTKCQDCRRAKSSRYRANHLEATRAAARVYMREYSKRPEVKARRQVYMADEARLAQHRDYLRRRTHQPLVGPLVDYEGQRTYLDCPACGQTELINVVDRPLTCQVCGARADRRRMWLFVPEPEDIERARKKRRDYLARLKVNEPERYRAQWERASAMKKAKRDAMLSRVGRLDDGPTTG